MVAAIDAELEAQQLVVSAAAEVAAEHPQPKDARAALKVLQLIRSAARQSRSRNRVGAEGGGGAGGQGGGQASTHADAVVAAVAAVSKANRLSSGAKDSDDEDAVVLEALAGDTARDNAARTELELLRQHAHARNWQRLRTAAA